MHEPAQPTRAARLRARATRKVRAVRKFAFGLTNTAHPLLVHIIPIRRCNIDCGYCNEYDKVSQPVPTEVMLERIDHLATLKSSVVAFSGGEPLLHPDLDLLLRHIRSRGMMAGLITNGYLLSPKRILALNEAGLDFLQISIDNIEPDEVSKKSLRLLDKKLEWLRDYATFDININSVLGGGIKNPEDARTINRRARQLGFSTSIGIIHDGQGGLKPLGPAERAVFDGVTREISGTLADRQEPLLGDPRLPGEPGRRQAERLAVPGRGALLLRLRERPRPLLLAAARLPRRAAPHLHDSRHLARVPDAEVVRAVLHDRLRPSRLDDGLLAQAAGRRRSVGPTVQRRARAALLAVSATRLFASPRRASQARDRDRAATTGRCRPA